MENNSCNLFAEALRRSGWMIDNSDDTLPCGQAFPDTQDVTEEDSNNTETHSSSEAENKRTRYENGRIKWLKKWAFTIFNYSHKTVSNLLELVHEKKLARYIIVGKETSKNGNEHLQGFVIFTNRTTFHQAKEHLQGDEELQGLHVEAARGSDEENENYCKKEGNAVSAGKLKEESVKKDSNDTLQTMVDFILDNEQFDEDSLYKKFGKHYLKQGKNAISLARGIMSSRKRKQLMEDMEDIDLKSWQQECLNLIHNQNDRQILWIIDVVGGAGKTFLCKQLVSQFNAFYSTSTNGRDVACAYNGENMVIFDLTRENSEQINYSTIEALKNGIVFSGKYKSRLKVAHGATKVVVMMNKEPDMTKLSRDRWHTMRLDGEHFQVISRCMQVAVKRERSYLHNLVEID
jgi:hypothetical protein